MGEEGEELNLMISLSVSGSNSKIWKIIKFFISFSWHKSHLCSKIPRESNKMRYRNKLCFCFKCRDNWTKLIGEHQREILESAANCSLISFSSSDWKLVEETTKGRSVYEIYKKQGNLV